MPSWPPPALGPATVLPGVERQRHLQAAQLLVLGAQDSLGSVVAVGQPEWEVRVRQVEVRLRERVGSLRDGEWGTGTWNKGGGVDSLLQG